MAVVDTKGVVTAVGEGEAVITATTVLPYYATASCKVTVGKALEGGEEEPDGPNSPKEPDGTEDTESERADRTGLSIGTKSPDRQRYCLGVCGVGGLRFLYVGFRCRCFFLS